MKKIELLENEYEIIKDDNNVFDLEEVTSLATDYFKPYDYILGDFSYGKLRLKGFYKNDNKKATKINKYSYLEEYLNNYCAFKCKYFIIEKLLKK
ncbi:MAG: YutD family protein [Bacilli bacterium]|nr:YutD family protein [Bacilli bacterium]